MHKEEIIPGMAVCLTDGKGIKYCNSRITKTQNPFIGPYMVLVDGVEDPVLISSLKPFCKGWYTSEEAKSFSKSK